MGIFDKLKEKNKEAKAIYEKEKDNWKVIYKTLCKKDKRRMLKLLANQDIKKFTDGLCDDCKKSFDIKHND